MAAGAVFAGVRELAMNSRTLLTSAFTMTVPLSSTLIVEPFTVTSGNSTRRPAANNRGARAPCHTPSRDIAGDPGWRIGRPCYPAPVIRTCPSTPYLPGRDSGSPTRYCRRGKLEFQPGHEIRILFLGVNGAAFARLAHNGAVFDFVSFDRAGPTFEIFAIEHRFEIRVVLAPQNPVGFVGGNFPHENIAPADFAAWVCN